MRNVNIKLLLLASILSLTSCGGSNSNSNIDTESGEATQTETSQESNEADYHGEKWKQSLQSQMQNVLGEYLPYIKLDDGYKHTIIESPSKDKTIFIFEEDTSDSGLTQQYVDILAQTNYVFDRKDSNDTYYNYYKDLGNDEFIRLRFGYYPGDPNSNLPCGFEIYAYKDVPVVEVSSWTAEEEFLIKQNLGEIFPCPRFTDRHTTYWDNDLNAIVVVDYKMTTAQYNEYINRIKIEGYLPKDDGQTSFPTYEKPTSNNPLYVISIDPYNHNELGAIGVEIYVKRIKDVSESSVWPKKEIDRRFGEDPDIKAIPEYNFEGKYLYYFNKGTFNIKVYKQVKENLDSYLTLLNESNFTINYDSSSLTYIAINSKKNVVLFITHTSDFQKITFEISKLS